jgi:hypothetical protein
MKEPVTHVTYLLKKADSILSPYELTQDRDSIKLPKPFYKKCFKILKWILKSIIILLFFYLLIAFIVEYFLNKPPEIY